MVFILYDYCLPLSATTLLCVWAVSCVTYINVINEPTGTGNRHLSNKIMTLHWQQWTSFSLSTSPFPCQFHFIDGICGQSDTPFGEVCLQVLLLPHQYHSINAPPIFISITTITRKYTNSMYNIHKFTTN